LGAVRRIERTAQPVARVAADLGVNENTLHGWLKRYRDKPNKPFPGSGKLSPDDEQVKKMERQMRELREERDFKKGGSLLRQESEIERFKFIKANRHYYRVAKLCKVLMVSRSGYYAWDKRPQSKRAQEDEAITTEIKKIHEKSRRAYGSRKITEAICRKRLVNHKRIERLMRQADIRSKVAKKFKATTNSKHSLPVAENVLNREFRADRPNQKMMSDITYLWTDEGWLYVAAVMDLFGQKIVGLSMSERMTKELVMNALESAWLHGGRPSGVLIHSDRGSQYCSKDYQALLHRPPLCGQPKHKISKP